MGNDQDERELCRLVLKIKDSALTIPKTVLPPASHGYPRPSWLVDPLDTAQPKGSLGNSNLILVQPPGFSSWTDIILDHKDNDHSTEGIALQFPHSGPHVLWQAEQ